ncbi:hypothetical protein ACDY96_11330 [Rhizobium mongolense]|uniref:hypothetical protein n=1 Tax=Rhizobium TaxID=379 RepID=UPI0024B1AD7F|nr:hypothetical protein [Rhizobium sp. CC1099]WFU87774.1 hypothetical protein QA644_01350 [Rhizobium sp. CC1099]
MSTIEGYHEYVVPAHDNYCVVEPVWTGDTVSKVCNMPVIAWLIQTDGDGGYRCADPVPITVNGTRRDRFVHNELSQRYELPGSPIRFEGTQQVKDWYTDGNIGKTE